MLASSALLASAAATLPLQNAILSEPSKAAEDPGVSSATTTWTSLTQIPSEATIHIQKAWNTPVAATVYQKVLADDTNTTTDILRLKAAATIHAGDWLHAPPITAVGLRLSDEDIRIAVGFRLGSRTCQPHSCLCGSMVDAQGLHSLSCRKSAPRQIRHAQINNIIWISVRRRSTRQSRNQWVCRGRMAKDLTVRRRSHGREASHWCGTLPYQTHSLTRTLVTRRRERQQRLTERQQTKQQNTQIWLRRTTSCLSQSRRVEHGTSWH